MPLRTLPLGSFSLAGNSNRIASTPALIRWAAIWEPMTPAPRTATLRTAKRGFAAMAIPEGRRRHGNPHGGKNEAAADVGRRFGVQLERLRILQTENIYRSFI